MLAQSIVTDTFDSDLRKRGEASQMVVHVVQWLMMVSPWTWTFGSFSSCWCCLRIIGFLAGMLTLYVSARAGCIPALHIRFPI